MVPGAGWEAQYAVHNADGTWDLTTQAKLPVIVWDRNESGNVVGYVVSPVDLGDAGNTLAQAGAVTFMAPDGRTLSFYKYVP